MDKVELLPCPFCGEPLSTRASRNSYGRCDTPGCWMHDRKTTVAFDDLAQIAAWNTRLSPAPEGADARELPPFKQAWSKKEAAGCRYNGHALENVAFGYEIARQELKALSRPPAEQVRMREALIAAYEAGATDVHEHWAAGNQEREADFGEAARDYADAALSTAPVPEDKLIVTGSTDRFYVDHDMIHDRVTGKHVTTAPDDEIWNGGTITDALALLNELAAEQVTPIPGDEGMREALEEATEVIGVCIDGFEKSNPTLGGLAAIHMLKEARERYRTILALTPPPKGQNDG